MLCSFCNIDFVPSIDRKNRRFCSKRCGVASFAAARRRRERYPRACVLCSKIFTPNRRNARCCSVACRNKQLRKDSYIRNRIEQLAASKAAAARLRSEVIYAYGRLCECCGEEHLEFLTIDHKHGGGSKERKSGGASLYKRLKKLGFPKDKYRCLCMNCNWSLGKWGYCPHNKENK